MAYYLQTKFKNGSRDIGSHVVKPKLFFSPNIQPFLPRGPWYDPGLR